jgi:hypothetical protein
MDIRREAMERGWAIEVDNGHHFRANCGHWIVSVWYTADGKVLIADLMSPDDVTRELSAQDTEKSDTVLDWLRGGYQR